MVLVGVQTGTVPTEVSVAFQREKENESINLPLNPAILLFGIYPKDCTSY